MELYISQLRNCMQLLFLLGSPLERDILWTYTRKRPLTLHILVVTYRSLNCLISNGNRIEWSPIRSVIIQVINKIGRPHSGSLICLITSMITDRIGRHEVLLSINHNFNKICDIKGYFLNQNTRNLKFCLASSEKKAI